MSIAKFIDAFTMMVVVASGIVAVAAIGISALFWFAARPLLQFLLG